MNASMQLPFELRNNGCSTTGQRLNGTYTYERRLVTLANELAELRDCIDVSLTFPDYAAIPDALCEFTQRSQCYLLCNWNRDYALDEVRRDT